MAKFSSYQEPCPICRTPAEILATDSENQYLCPRCGRYNLIANALSNLRMLPVAGREIANASGWVREQSGFTITLRDLVWLHSVPTPTVSERASKALLALGQRMPDIGASLDIDFNEDGVLQRWMGITWSTNEGEVRYLFLDCLRNQELIRVQPEPGLRLMKNIVITPKGHKEIERFRQGGADSAVGFCAMWFEPRLLPMWTDGISPAIKDAGYDPKRIDRVEHNNKVDDEIVAMIRRSRFVVADFTGNRGGVYFEAGLALGRSIPVVWTIRVGRINRVHFDSRQYNFIEWSFDALPDFRTRLKNRIDATIGHGPLP